MNAEWVSLGQVSPTDTAASGADHSRAGPVAAGPRNVNEPDYRRLIGKRLRASRVWQQLSQDEVATRAGDTRNFVSAIERGARSLDAFRLRRVAVVLGIELADLLAAESSWHPRPEPYRSLSE